MQISADYDFSFLSNAEAKEAAGIINAILSEKKIDVWHPEINGNQLITFGTFLSWEDYEGLLLKFAKEIAIAMPSGHFDGKAHFLNMSSGDDYGDEVHFEDGKLLHRSGANLFGHQSYLKFCPYCGEEYDVEAIAEDIKSGNFPLEEDGTFCCFQCEQPISLEELEGESTAIEETTYSLNDGKFIAD